MKYRRYCIIGILGLLCFCFTASGQDVVFNHPYSGMLYANPAYTGIFNAVHVGLSYRNQFTASPSPYNTYYAEADAFIDKWSCAFGAFILHTRAAGSQLTETAAGLSYMFNVKMSEDLAFKPAIQAVFYNKQRNFRSYVFPDRIDITGTIIPLEPQDYEPYNANNIDFAAGGIIHYRQLELGASIQHLFAQQLDNESTAPVKSIAHAKRAIVHAKYVFSLNLNDRETTEVELANWSSFNEIKLIPYLQFIYQRNYQYLTGGVLIQSGALFAGGGVKTALEQDITNIALSGGFATSDLRIGYSIDFIALGNTLKGWSGTSHEVFLHLSFGQKSSKSRAKWKKSSTCGCYL